MPTAEAALARTRRASLPSRGTSGTFAAMLTPSPVSPAASTAPRFVSSTAALVALALLAVACLPTLGACGGTRPGAPFRRAKLTAAEEFECEPADIREVGGMEWTGGARYALVACGQRYTYECDRTSCTRTCDYVPVASTYSGPGESAGEHTEFVRRWAAAEFGCDTVRQVSHSRSSYTLSVCGQEVVYDCDDDEGCARRCD